ncbi:MAG: transglutaminase family protein [Proteobacteria bacterium]|nr:transglutaminase family protein [Pseudomonadota bacterium]
MPHVRVTHATEYRYNQPVKLLRHRLMLRPRDSHDLQLLDATLTLSPPAVRQRWAHDVQSNSVLFVDFDQTETDLLRIVSTLDLEHYPTGNDFPLETSAELYPFSYAVEEVPDLARLAERHSPDPERKVDAWARKFLNPKGPTRTMDLLVAMTRAIKSDFAYQGREAEGTNTPTVTLATRSGACRDFALLMMEAARALGFAARFISGYLYDEALVDSADPVVGGGATHAWVAIYLPGTGWVEFDPTNGLIAGRNLIRVSVARTPEQAVPVSGGFIGAPNSFQALDVNVTVTVGTLAPPADAAPRANPVPSDTGNEAEPQPA